MEFSLLVEDLEVEQQAKLQATFGCSDSELPDRLARIAAAAYEDYLEMIQGVPLPSRTEEVRERRLLHLLKKYATDGVLLKENEIAAMFQMTEQEAGRLLRHVRSHYHAELDARVRTEVQGILQSAEQNKGGYCVQVTSANLLDALRSTVTSVAPDLNQIIKVRGSAALYDIPPDTYSKLCEFYGVDHA